MLLLYLFFIAAASLFLIHTQRIRFRILLNKTKFLNVITFILLIQHQTEFRLVLNLAENCNFNLNLVIDVQQWVCSVTHKFTKNNVSNKDITKRLHNQMSRYSLRDDGVQYDNYKRLKCIDYIHYLNQKIKLTWHFKGGNNTNKFM